MECGGGIIRNVDQIFHLSFSGNQVEMSEVSLIPVSWCLVWCGLVVEKIKYKIFSIFLSYWADPTDYTQVQSSLELSTFSFFRRPGLSRAPPSWLLLFLIMKCSPVTRHQAPDPPAWTLVRLCVCLFNFSD